jgi:hypothetical protein
MTVIRLRVPRHWRPEVGDVAATLRDALRRDGEQALVVARWDPRAALRLASGLDAVLVSDVRPAAAAWGAGSALVPRVFRLWWNGADEVLDHLHNHPASLQETHISFFDDVVADLQAAGLDAVHVPYAFSAPRPPARTFEDVIGYTGEVDIGDGALEGIGLRSERAAALSAAVWDRANAVVAGSATLVEADRSLRHLPDVADNASHGAALWSMRNRVRYLLLKEVQQAFPGRLVLRGTDWRQVGFEAQPTTFRRRARMEDYHRHRVSLDLGSKSTHAALYPRSADIMAMGGGLTQLDSGAPFPAWTPALNDRRVRSGEALVAVVDRLLSLSPSALAQENEEIQLGYTEARLDSGSTLAREILARVATSRETST